jgi:hypothetical protein
MWYNQGYFCDRTLQHAVPEFLYKKSTSWNGVPQPLSPGIDISNTSLSLTECWVTLCIPERIFFRKIALGITTQTYHVLLVVVCFVLVKE